MAKCIWYVSGFRRPWEAALIGNLAAALKTQGVPLQVYVEGGTGALRMDDVFSWPSLTFLERLSVVLFRGRLWHLWGPAPFWWGLIRLRARTVHTALDALPEWKGHPTRLFAEQAREGESLLKPAFEVKVAMAGDSTEDGFSTLLPETAATEALEKAIARSEMKTVVLKETAISDSDLRKCGLVVVDEAPSGLLLAAWLTLQGLPVVARKSSLIAALLGRDGYVAVEEDTEDAWAKALAAARSDEGRAVAAAARRFLKENYSTSEAVESLVDLYRSVARGKD